MNILLADDHQMTINGFKMMLTSEIITSEIYFSECSSCEDTFLSIQKELSENKTFDLALLDYSMPAYTLQNINSGGDLCLYIKKVMPDCRVFIVTAVTDTITLFDIIQNINPDGFALKSDLSYNKLSEIINAILQKKIYRSEGIIKKYNEIWETDVFVNELNRKILHYISLGYKIKEISTMLFITEGAINKRIVKIKTALNISCDSNILKEAKKRGLV